MKSNGLFFRGWMNPLRAAALLLLLLAALPAFAYADEVGVITRVEGKVDILRQGAREAVEARLNYPVSMEDVIRTKTGGKAEIRFKDDTVLRIAGSSRLKIDKYVFNPDKTRQTASVTLFRGKVRAVVSKTATAVPVSTNASTFNVNTPTAVAGVMGTDLFVFYDKGITGVIFKDGKGFVFTNNVPDKVVRVGAGFVTFVTGAGAPPLEPRPATQLELDQHVKDTSPFERPGGTGKGKHNGAEPEAGNGSGERPGGKKTGGDAGTAEETGSTGTVGALDSTTVTSAASGGLSDAANEGTFGYTPPPVIAGPATDTGATDPLKDNPALIPPYVPPVTTADTTPPALSVAGAPPSFTNQAAANLIITSNEPSTFFYKLDGVSIGTVTPSTSDTFNITGLPEGGHTLVIEGKDGAGNVSAQVVINWTTDYTPPVVSIPTAPATITNQNTATFGVASNETSTYAYTLDGTLVAGTTGLSIPVEGTHTFTVTATDAAGNTSNQSYTWTTDYTPPVVSIPTTPATITNQNTATFGVASNETSTYAYT
ncbi:MAG: FecR domain-containing protein, partial [Deltaproteobacteria bacterium]|nr:FecR domain-containing protein [Deltaproteobacteria bacterium]